MRAVKEATKPSCLKEFFDFGNVLSLDERFDLCRPFSEGVIKQVIFSIPNTKSSGPDGFSSVFLKGCWNEVGSLVANAI